VRTNTISFVAHNCKIVNYKAYELKNVEKKITVKEADIFRIASQSKVISSFALMTLFEEGKFMFND
jgi:CubicO group peptidase (beta-lactamase class C family)